MTLIQERYKDDPWKVLACCVLLNRVSGTRAESTIHEFFRRYPTPALFLRENRWKIMSFLKPLGFYHVRTLTLREMTKAWLSKVPYDRLPGIGKYGQDAYRIIVEGNLNVEPEDEKLRAYVQDRARATIKRPRI